MKIDKKLLTRFIDTYYLGGISDEHQTVIYECSEDNIEVNLKPAQSGYIRIKTILNNSFGENVDFAVMKTSKLLKTIDILNDDINIELERKNDILRSLILKSDKLKGTLCLADQDLISKPSPIKVDVDEIPYNLEFDVDSNFMKKFIKTTSTFSDKNHFVIHNNKNNNSNLLTINYDNNSNLDVFSFEIDADFVDLSDKIFYFNSTYLAAIFKSNDNFENVKFRFFIKPDNSEALITLKFEDEYIQTLYLLSSLRINKN